MEKVYADLQGYILFWKCQWMDFTKTLMNDFNILIISHTQCRGPGYCCTSRLLGLTKMENKVHTRGLVTVLFDCTIFFWRQNIAIKSNDLRKIIQSGIMMFTLSDLITAKYVSRMKGFQFILNYQYSISLILELLLLQINTNILPLKYDSTWLAYMADII